MAHTEKITGRHDIGGRLLAVQITTWAGDSL
ncbi:hypothetical protein H4W80_002455 [Nonomuraea angiospora]|uniref:Uncharacterized protein n=1 Tax=Nonomuraea angiospora TaxID=46172 RepID=A0ABR9LU71_9ACTN|nr:hypothetical protein [Nonomuraea angiospora]